MLIECLVVRDGVTPVTFKDHVYEFMPIPGTMEGEMGTSVANVANQEAVDYFIGNKEKNVKGRPGFRQYRPKQAQDDMLSRRKELEDRVGKFAGYSVQVLNIGGNDRGYMIRHEVKDEQTKFCGQNGIWTDDMQRLIPFGKMGDADTWLRAFIGGATVEYKPMKKYPCADCEAAFDTPLELGRHLIEAHSPDAVVTPEPKKKIDSALSDLEEAAPRYSHTPSEKKGA